MRIVQAIEDGFQDKKRSVLVLLDFSKAYDTVWRQKLLTSMSEKGVPTIYIKWLNEFLQDRTARVRFNGVLGKSQLMKQGVPQGSVLAPLLFLFYINNLAEILPPETLNAMFADDVSVLATEDSAAEAEATAQVTVDIVSKWSKEWKLSLNATKSETCYFTLSRANQEPKFAPTISIDGKNIRHEKTPRLLGVILDRELTFTPHTQSVVARVKRKQRMLSALANSEWGWRKEHLRRVYLSIIRSVLDYAAPAWQPYLRKDNIDKLEIAQNTCLRRITGQAKSAPIEGLQKESNIPSYRSVSNSKCMKARERALRLPEDHPRRICLDQPTVPLRLPDRRSCRSKALELSANLPNEASNRKPICLFSAPPWKAGAGDTNIFCNLPGITGRHDSPEAKIAAAYDRIDELGGDYIIYTDGSASGGTHLGGSAAVITQGDPRSPTILETIMEKGSFYTCSYEEECTAMNLAVDWLIENNSTLTTIITDSQSLCEALLGYSPDLDDLRTKLRGLRHIVNIQWVPGHSEIVGNELADQAAKQATLLESAAQPISYNSICTQINMMTRDPPIAHERSREVYGSISAKKEREITSRADQTLLAKVRSGHTTLFLEYRARMEPDLDTTCPLCQDSPHNLVHWMTECAGTLNKRRQLFGAEDMGKLSSLTKYPRAAVALCRSTLLSAWELLYAVTNQSINYHL